MEAYTRAYRDPKSPLTPIVPISGHSAFSFDINSEDTQSIYSTALEVFKERTPSPYPACKSSSQSCSRAKSTNELVTRAILKSVNSAAACCFNDKTPTSRKAICSNEDLHSKVKSSCKQIIDLSKENLPCMKKSIAANLVVPSKTSVTAVKPTITAAKPGPNVAKPSTVVKRECCCSARSRSSSKADDKNPPVLKSCSSGSKASVSKNSSQASSAGTLKREKISACCKSSSKPSNINLEVPEGKRFVSNGGANTKNFKKFSLGEPGQKRLSPLIATLLEKFNLSKFKDLFEREEIDEIALSLMRPEDLKKIGINDEEELCLVMQLIHTILQLFHKKMQKD